MKGQHLHTKMLRQKPILRQIEWRVQNGPIIKIGFLPLTASFFGRFNLSLRTSCNS